MNNKNIILAFGNKEFNKSLVELKQYFKFNLEVSDNLIDQNIEKNYQGLILHEDALKNSKIKTVINNENINKIIFYSGKIIKNFHNIEKLKLPTSVEQINKVIIDNIVKNEFKANSSLKINDYILNKNSRKLIKQDKLLELTEKEIELIELLSKKAFIQKKEILSIIWKYSDNADTHTVETHIYRLRKKINDVFNDDKFIKSEKRGYTI